MSAPYQIGIPFTATVAVQTALTVPYVNSFFIVNDGDNAVTYTVYGSPDGKKAGDKDKDGNILTAAEIAKRWVSVDTGSVTTNKSINVSASPYQFFRVDVSTSAATSAIRIWSNTITKLYAFLVTP